MKKGYIYIALTTVLFSTMEIALKVISGNFNPIQLNFLRFFIGALILIPPAIHELRRRNVKISKNDIPYFAFTGFLCVVVSMVLYQLAIACAPASIVAVLFSCNPIFVIILAFFFLKEKIYKSTVATIILSIIGIMIIVNPLHMTGSATGIILCLLSAITFALYSVVGKKKTAEFGGVVFTCVSFLFGSIEMAAIMGLTHIAPIANMFKSIGLPSFANIPFIQGITPATLPNLLYIGVFVTGLGYCFFFLAMEATSASTASLVFFIKPALAPFLALALIGEPIHLAMICGIILIISGSAINFIPAFKPQTADIQTEINLSQIKSRSTINAEDDDIE